MTKRTYRKVAVAALFDVAKKSFILRQDNDDGYTQWIRGGIEKGEKATDTAIREIAEEAGYVDVEIITKLGKEIEITESFNEEVRTSYCTSYLVELNSAKQIDKNLTEGEFSDYRLIALTDSSELESLNTASYVINLFKLAEKELKIR